MYEDCFELDGRPFLPTPRAERYIPTPVIETARLTLARCIERGEGAGLLIGPPGTGKTLLCQVLAQRFADTFSVVQLTAGRLATRSALLQAILYELGQPYRGLDEGELRLALVDFLEPREDGNAGLLLLVDEAHTLPLRLLEEIRMITNLVRDGQPRARVVLAGSPLLEERFASPKLASFAQRVAARCYLEALDARETADYVLAQITAVGGDASQLLDQDTLRSVYQATDGIPRLINQVCDHALLLASLGGASRLTSEAIEEAWADLQQLPTPWNGAAENEASGSVVEFGQLPEAGHDLPEAIPFRKSQEQPLHVAHTEEASSEAGEPSAEVYEPWDNSAIGQTEVELDFPEFGDPSAEEFQEEEVVLDRYAPEFETFAGVPKVTSWEGRQLASMLWPVDPSPSPDQSPESAPPEPAAYETEEAAVAVSGDFGCGPIVEFATTGGVPVEGVTLGDEAEIGSGGVVSDAGQATFWAGARASDDQSEMIVIDDERAPTGPRPPRKRAYRQLFTRLRRG